MRPGCGVGPSWREDRLTRQRHDDRPVGRHNLSDWLALHDLDQSLCRRLLSATAGQIGSEPIGRNECASVKCALDRDAQWLRAVDAMCAFFPRARGTIERTYENTSKILAKGATDHRRAVTFNDGGNGYPFILYTYRGTVSDCMVIAHEFGHAIQIVASQGKFVTPVIREACAFIGELALISHARASGDNCAFGFQQVWYRDNCKYFRVDQEELESVLSHPESIYRYSWNYPIARHLSIEISQKLSIEHIWAVFEGKVSMLRLLNQLGYLSGRGFCGHAVIGVAE